LTATMPKLRDIYLARRSIAAISARTPLIHSVPLTKYAGQDVYLKLESLQQTGSFKIRGAANKIYSLKAEEKERGVVTGSSGNHGLAVAFIAKSIDIKAVVCVSAKTPKVKVNAINDLGAEVVLFGDSYDTAVKHAKRLAKDRQLTMIDSFDDPYVIAGQGTIGVELLEDLPEIDTALVPVAGGGLLCGIALALKSANPTIRVLGVSMEHAPVMYHSLRAGKPIEMKEKMTIAHALAGGLGENNQYTFRMTREYVDDIVLVSEEAIMEAMLFALENHHVAVEGAGAVGIAAILQNKVRKPGGNLAVVVSGGNVDIPLLMRIAQERNRLHEGPHSGT